MPAGTPRARARSGGEPPLSRRPGFGQPPDMGILSSPRRYVWQWELDAPPERLWPLVADTDRFNRDTGLPPVEDMRAPDEELAPGRRHLRIRVAGVPVEWEESPFEWVAPTRFGVLRRYRR